LARNGGCQAANYAKPGLIPRADARRPRLRQPRDSQSASAAAPFDARTTEGFHRVYVLNGVEEIEAAVFERERLLNDARDDDHGPFDIVGDVHGCFYELCGLLSELGCEANDTATDAKHVGGRRVIFLATWSAAVRRHRPS